MTANPSECCRESTDFPRPTATWLERVTSEPQLDAGFDSGVLRLRIIVGALIAGCLGLAGVAIVLRGQGIFGPGPALPVISLIAVVQALATLAIRPIVLSQMLRGARERLLASDSVSDAAWMQVLTTRTIVVRGPVGRLGILLRSPTCSKASGGLSPAARLMAALFGGVALSG